VVEWGVGQATVTELLERCPVAKASPFHDRPKAHRVTSAPRPITATYNDLMEGPGVIRCSVECCSDATSKCHPTF
jgi:hypothetical protein